MNKFLSLIRLEARAIFGDFSILMVVFVGNILYSFFYPTPYLNDIALSQKIALIDEDKTALSREFYHLLKANPKLEVTTFLNMDEARGALENQKIFGIVLIPSGFEEKRLKKSAPDIYFIANNAYFFVYSVIIEGLNETLNALAEKNAIEKSALKWKFFPLYNPSVGYLNYILAVILVLILHQTMIMANGILAGTQNRMLKNARDSKTESSDFYFLSVNPLMLISARISVFFIIYFALFLFYFGFIYLFFGLNTLANVGDLGLFGAVFIIATLAFGVFLGSFFDAPHKLPQIVLISSLPILFALGFVFPSELIPNFIRAIMHFIPALPAVSGFLELNQMGADLAMVAKHIWHLSALAVFYIALGAISFKLKYKGVL